jgi:hypothetical protein
LGRGELPPEAAGGLEYLIKVYRVTSREGAGKETTPKTMIAAIDDLLAAQTRFAKTLDYSFAVAAQRWPKATERYEQALRRFTSPTSAIDADSAAALEDLAADCQAALDRSDDDLPAKMSRLASNATTRREQLMRLPRIATATQGIRILLAMSERFIFRGFAEPRRDYVPRDDNQLRKFSLAVLRAASIPVDDYIEHPSRLIELLSDLPEVAQVQLVTDFVPSLSGFLGRIASRC